ncbi:carboxypeptidase-like regulatory domain-containing protein [Chryseobacterium gotjawalense]|uniref:Carboxypeptidase-like regulatory domain-containing protein n=1 Tax=Chryseobacterium gotjawalense TaxID=3042315 RepID=A0ABY8RAW5_9FLAO|nr:carboxypeptidase-like regulatory domain-containing protein [Chryseobacterium sp. wdc7]WHF50348.1 carboxypeptidase-like regulatory domain-containing protein [Chryseobacterium sp. wdc7]
MKKASLLFILLLGFLINAQIISGTILSKEDRQPIPYAKIGIENENAGTIADENGHFKIDLTNIDINKTLKIEVGGFEKYAVSVKEFGQANPRNLILKEKVRDIQEVKISPRKFVQENWGINTKTKRITIGHNPSKGQEDQSKEIAVLFKNNKAAKIEKININISRFTADKPVFIRFTVYDKELNSILNEDITDKITAEKIINGTYTYDVSKNNIWINEDFYVGIQLLNYFEGSFYMSGAHMGNKTIYRNYLSGWISVPMVSPAINIDVKVQK